MREDIRKTIKSLSILLAISAVLIGGLAFLPSLLFQNKNGIEAPQTISNNIIEDVAGMKIGTEPFLLINHKGEYVSQLTFANKFRLMFFGFTYCPDICPTELAALSRVLERLSPEEKAQLNVIFVTVDPERDTVEQMEQYMSLFHPDIHGLTGRSDNVRNVISDYKIYAQRVQTEEMSDYTMDHTANMFLFDPYNKLIAIFKHGITDEEIVNFLRKVL